MDMSSTRAALLFVKLCFEVRLERRHVGHRDATLKAREWLAKELLLGREGLESATP
jgi:hypothetical protein